MAKKGLSLPCDEKRMRLIKIQAKTNPNYGCRPEERGVQDLFDNGVIFLDKPNGPTSHQVDSWLKKMLQVDRLGHGGTLDPNATGVLPIGVGRATRSLQVLLPLGKEYIAVMQVHKDVSIKRIQDCMKQFIGDVRQLPPVRSAVKRVRRKRQIYYLDIIQIHNREVLFRVGCESGTYIRTLCVDIGKKLGVGAHLAELRRTRVGKIRENNIVFLQDVKDALVSYQEDHVESEIRKILHPIEQLLQSTPRIVIRDSAIDALCHGADLAIPGVVEVDSKIKKGDMVGVFTLKDEAVAIAHSLMSTEEIIEKETGICAELDRVLMLKGTYPSIWKKS
jgi:H/ACA ribonucleoprotein complex subunit 4